MQRSGVDPQVFRDVMANFPTGVTVVTSMVSSGTDGASEPAGIAIGSFFSVSLDPVLVGFCVGSTSGSWSAMKSAGSFCVNILGSHQVDLCATMAAKGDKFAGVDFKVSPETKSPVLPGIIGFLDCVHETTFDGGDHDIVIGRVLAASIEAAHIDPMVFFRRRYGTFSADELAG